MGLGLPWPNCSTIRSSLRCANNLGRVGASSPANFTSQPEGLRLGRKVLPGLAQHTILNLQPRAKSNYRPPKGARQEKLTSCKMLASLLHPSANVGIVTKKRHTCLFRKEANVERIPWEILSPLASFRNRHMWPFCVTMPTFGEG